MYALIKNGEIVSYGLLPTKVYNNGRWYDLSTGDQDLIAQAGYIKVDEQPRPPDTETTTYEWTMTLVNGVPTQSWQSRPKTPEEIERDNEAREQLILKEKREAVADATLALMEATVHVDGAPWEQPEGAHNAYCIDAKVTHNGKTWVNTTFANVWEPGVSGWREVVTEGYPAWIQPTGVHDAYALGTRVTHNGQDWESNVPGNVWEPGVYGWILI